MCFGLAHEVLVKTVVTLSQTFTTTTTTITTTTTTTTTMNSLVQKMMLPLAFIAFVLTSTVTPFSALGNPRLLHVSTSSIGRANDISNNNSVGQPYRYNNKINNSNNFLTQQHSLQYRHTHRYGLMIFNNKMFDEIDKKLDSVIETQKNMQETQKNMQEAQKNKQSHINTVIEKQNSMQSHINTVIEKQNSMESTLNTFVTDLAELQEICRGIDKKMDDTDQKQDTTKLEMKQDYNYLIKKQDNMQNQLFTYFVVLLICLLGPYVNQYLPP
jgi:hypothetical protein